MAPYRANQEKRGRISALLISLEDQIEDAIAIASIREQVRTLGIDRVRGL
jgi:hypothetical protein